MLTRLITRSKTLRRNYNQYLKNTSTQLQHIVDKYQLIKKFLIIGTIANLYFCYLSYAKYSIYSEVSQNIRKKFEEWNRNQLRNKELVFQLMKEMDAIKEEKNQALVNGTNVVKFDNSEVKDGKQNKSADSHNGDQNAKKGWFSFLKGSNKSSSTSNNSPPHKKDEYI